MIRRILAALAVTIGPPALVAWWIWSSLAAIETTGWCGAEIILHELSPVRADSVAA